MATAKKKTAAPSKEPVVTKKAVKPAPQPVAKPAAKPAQKPVSKAPVKKPAPVKAAQTAVQPVTAEKAKKPKLVRDSFTIPKTEYVVLDELKSRAAKLTRPAKKSELLRAGIKLLAALSDSAFLAALEQVPAIKTGRPAAQ